MRYVRYLFTGLFVCAMSLFIAVANAQGSTASDGLLPLNSNEFPLASRGECSRRAGPFVTQTTAWNRLRQAKGKGYAVSGVFPCYDGYGTRGYCFNYFFPCR